MYWRFHGKVKKMLLEFEVLSRIFHVDNWIDTKKQDAGAAWTIFRFGLYSSLISIFMFFITERADPTIQNVAPSIHNLACIWTQYCFFFSLERSL